MECIFLFFILFKEQIFQNIFVKNMLIATFFHQEMFKRICLLEVMINDFFFQLKRFGDIWQECILYLYVFSVLLYVFFFRKIIIFNTFFKTTLISTFFQMLLQLCKFIEPIVVIQFIHLTFCVSPYNSSKCIQANDLKYNFYI